VGKLEGILFVALVVGVAVCLSLALYAEYCSPDDHATRRSCVLLGLAGALLGWAAVALVLRDLYLRPFPDANAKMLWTLAILMTGGIGLFVYVFAHAMKPRIQKPGPICREEFLPSRGSTGDD
jgi:hypothetical protein